MKKLIYLLIVVLFTSCLPVMHTKSYGTNCDPTPCGGMTRFKKQCNRITTNCSGRCKLH
jgi:hypothetical protein